ncbi:hypothetical protein LPJ73_007929, partial [Coemansia sp. RSA 2703]
DLAGRAVDWPLVDADELAACQPVAGALEIRAYAEQSVRRDDSNERILPSEEDNVLPAEEDDIIPADDALPTAGAKRRALDMYLDLFD